MDAHALRQWDWSISAIVCHPGDDRMIMRSVVIGKRAVGVRVPAVWRWRDPFTPMTQGRCIGGAL